jgi:uncharacterized caspase-like protein
LSVIPITVIGLWLRGCNTSWIFAEGRNMRVSAIALSLLALLLTFSGARAETRVALVIGNGAYRNMPKRDNAPDDAKAMAALLRTVGFEVIEATDLTRDEMTQRLLEFGRKADGADVALLYYAGQAVALDGVNYLLGTDAKLKGAADVKLSGVDLDASIDQTTGHAHARLVFFDAPRSNPFGTPGRQASTARTVVTGLAEMRELEGSLTAFASSPGRDPEEGPKGGHSPFTSALLKYIAAPGVEIQMAMSEVRAEVNDQTHKKQMPWGNTNLIGTLYLNPQPAPAEPK